MGEEKNVPPVEKKPLSAEDSARVELRSQLLRDGLGQLPRRERRSILKAVLDRFGLD